MQYFIDKAQISYRFCFEENFGILEVGYQNFKCNSKPFYNFRVQNFYTWHLVLSGSGYLYLQDRSYEITEGMMFFLPPDVEFRYFPKEEAPWEYIWFACKGNMSKYYGELLGFSYTEAVKKNEHFNTSKYVLKELFSTLEEGMGYFGVLANFYKLMELYTVKRPYTGLEEAKRLIDEGFTHNDFSIDQLCCDVGISHTYLLQLFKEKFGLTLVQYLQQKRIEYACQLLLSTELSVKSVAFSCGFSDELHFMKVFKKKMHISALQYRKSPSQEEGL